MTLPRLLLPLLLALPSLAAADWSARGWDVRCAATSIGTALSVEPALPAGETCVFTVEIDPLRPETILVPPEARAAYRAILDSVSRWYDEHGFGPPLVRRADERRLELPDAYWSNPRVEPNLTPKPLVAHIDDGIAGSAFLALVDPFPALRGLHVDPVLGFYDSLLRIMVFDFERGTDMQIWRGMPSLRAISEDTVAHEMFHAIARGYHGGAVSRFIEEGLAETYGRLYARDVGRGDPLGPLQTRIVEARFTHYPLMSSDGDEAYDSAPFWMHLFDRGLPGFYPHDAIQRLLSDYDLTEGENGAAAVDAWLRSETGRGLGPHWTDFARRVSQEAALEGALDDLAHCVTAEMTAAPDRGQHVWRIGFGSRDYDRFSMLCVRLTLPGAGLDRVLSIETVGSGLAPEEIDVFNGIFGANLREGQIDVGTGFPELMFIITPRLEDGDTTSEAVQVPDFEFVLVGVPVSCGFDPVALSDADEARLATFAGTYAHDLSVVTRRFGRACDLRDTGDPTFGGGTDLEIRLVDRQLVLGEYHPLQPLPGVHEMSEVPAYAGACGPLLLDPRLDYLDAEDWVTPVPDDRMFFLIDDGQWCDRVAVLGNGRLAIVEPYLGLGAGLPEEWWSRGLVRR